MSGDLRRDPLSGRLVAVAAARARRPGVGVPRIGGPTPDELAACPFCAGREERTPPEALALGRAAGAPDTPGWRVRVVPNLYPAFERQEVVVHSPEHVRGFADLADDQVALVAEAWRLRAEAARRAGFAYLHALVNEGRQAGASLAHSHSQLVWLHEPPPAVAGEDAAAVAAVVREEREAGERVVLDTGALVLLCPKAARVPYELLIAPGSGGGDPFEDELLPGALLLLRESVRRLRAVEGPVPWNAWLHAGPHWHVHVLPRLTVAAGIELGAGIGVNPLPPEAAAAALRAG